MLPTSTIGIIPPHWNFAPSKVGVRGISCVEDFRGSCCELNRAASEPLQSRFYFRRVRYCETSMSIMYRKISTEFPASFQLIFRRQCGLILSRVSYHMGENFVIRVRWPYSSCVYVCWVDGIVCFTCRKRGTHFEKLSGKSCKRESVQ